VRQIDATAPYVRPTGLFDEKFLDATRDQYRHVHQNQRQADTSRCHQILGLPGGVKLGFVAAQALKVIEVLAVAKNEITDAMPGRCQRMALQAGQWCYAQAEPAESLLARPQHQFHEQKVHRPGAHPG
jgi:hypothetical protein